MNKEIKTALITGASAGIGKAYAIYLAKMGIDVILVARNSQKLADIKKYITNKYNTKCDYFSLDLTQKDNIDILCELIKKTQPDLLINNAGFGRPGNFAELDCAEHTDMLNIHIQAVVNTCYAAFSYMTKNGGYIINVSSLACIFTVGGYTMYGATKSFIRDFSERLALEDDNIKVQLLLPGFTYTDFHSTTYYKDHFKHSKYPKFLWNKPENVAQISICALNTKKTVVIPGKINILIYWLFNNPLGHKLIKIFAKKYKQRPI